MKKEDFIYLIYKEYRGMITAEGKDYLDYWLSASTDNQKIKTDILLSMNLLDDYTPGFEMDLDDEFATMQSKLKDPIAEVVPSAVSTTEAKQFSMKPWMYAAASLIVMLGVFSIFSAAPNSQEMMLASTSAQEIKEVTLSDGSKVWLNENSTLEYPNTFAQDRRHLSLVGEAYFEVIKDTNRKFEVQTTESITTVLGTSFVINATPSNAATSILVRSGKVQFEDISSGNSETLKPFDKANLNHATDAIEKTKVSDLNYISWKTNKISFKSRTIEDVFDYLENKFDVEINDSNLNVKSCKITMTPQKADINQILSNIKKTHKIEIQKVGKRIYTIQGGEC